MLPKRNSICRQNCCKCIISEFLDPCKTQSKYRVQFVMANCHRIMRHLEQKVASGGLQPIWYCQGILYNWKTLGRNGWFLCSPWNYHQNPWNYHQISFKLKKSTYKYFSSLTQFSRRSHRAPELSAACFRASGRLSAEALMRRKQGQVGLSPPWETQVAVQASTLNTSPHSFKALQCVGTCFF